MTHDPTVLFVNNEWVNHPDHRAVGQVTVDAVFPTARDPLNFPEHRAEGLEPWKVGELYLWSTNEANQLVDIGETLDLKIAALAHHASQFRSFDDIARWVRRRSEELGERAGYGIIEEYGGHGVGREMHEPPHVPNFGRAGVGYKLKAGMVLALEPMFALGDAATQELDDHWTVRMRDGSLCAHFEETVAITEDGPEVLTRIG